MKTYIEPVFARETIGKVINVLISCKNCKHNMESDGDKHTPIL